MKNSNVNDLVVKLKKIDDVANEILDTFDN